jgi:hypothetical protein
MSAAIDQERVTMQSSKRHATSIVRRAMSFAATAAVVIGLMLCSHLTTVHAKGVKRPAPAEFGLGPRASANGLYVATLEPEQQLRPRAMQTVRLTIAGADGRAIEDATVTIDGGMPQHGHGLPTRPRVTRALGDGAYQIDGVRFNMGGWWEFKVAISGARGVDIVTFNLDL